MEEPRPKPDLDEVREALRERDDALEDVDPSPDEETDEREEPDKGEAGPP